eukprot:6414583-Amphidinium_carterae.3
MTLCEARTLQALKDNDGVAHYARSLSHMTADKRWNKELFASIQIPTLDNTIMRPNFSAIEEDAIGRAIVEQHFTKRRLNELQPGHRLWVLDTRCGSTISQPMSHQTCPHMMASHISMRIPQKRGRNPQDSLH